MVYLIVCEENSTCKIGYSCNHPERRLWSLRSASPYDIQLRCWVKGGPEHEKELHRKFEHLRLKREWFRLEFEILDYFEANKTEFLDETAWYEANYLRYDKDELIQHPVIMPRRMRRDYKPEELAIMLQWGKTIYELNDSNRKAVFDLISLVTVYFGRDYSEIKSMISLLCEMKTALGNKNKEFNELLDFIDSEEIHNP